MFRNPIILIISVVVTTGFGCGPGSPSNTDVGSNSSSNVNAVREIKLDPANMPPGLSGAQIPPSANLPPGISLNTNMPVSRTPIPGIPTDEQLKKGFKPKGPIPGIPDQETLRKQLNSPASNINAMPSNAVPTKGGRKLGGKP